MLRKKLGPIDVFSIAAGAMISSGLFVLPGIAFARGGPSIILSYAIAGIVVLPVMLSTAELATAMPRSGGTYFAVERSLGPLVGSIAGFSSWLAITLKATFALVGIGALGTLIVPQMGEWGVKLIAIAACLFFFILNLMSVKGVGRLQVFLVTALFAVLVAYVVKGFPKVAMERYTPFAPAGVWSVFAIAGMVFVSYGGLTKVVDVAEEVRNPGRNLPTGMILAFVLVNLLYVAVVAITVGVLSPEILSNSVTPISKGAAVSMGKLGAYLIGAGALMAFATTGNAGLLSASRTPMAMSRDGLLPRFLSRTNRRFKTPHYSLALTAAIMVLVVILLDIENLVKTASTIMVLMFILMNTAVVIMRYSGIQTYRPKFHAPLKPWLQIAANTVYVFLIIEMGTVPLAITGGFALAAIVWYLAYVQRRIDSESAIVYLVKTIVSRHIRRSNLEEELRLIALERDEITPDRFDELVRKCEILDIKNTIGAKELFKRAGEVLAPRLDVGAEKLYELFLERERETTTVIKPGLAIPHIILEGRNIFDILLVRCKDGIVFDDLHEPVRTAFVLIGSPDERNYHLRVLMIIAHILNEEDFERRWFDARNAEQLRDIVLLSSREREKRS
jgi:amino acid transporter/mannitol/fructose-specific phosphotransferase system IIA component (Ntr-type)